MLTPNSIACWTSIPTHGEEDLNIHRGAWAGHRFDVVTLETHREEEKSREWQDISASVLNEAEVLRRRLLRRR